MLIMSTLSYAFEEDTFKTSKGDIKISFIGHGTLMFTLKSKVIHIDPFSRLADYSGLPKADLVLITHHHRDHLDLEALKLIIPANKIPIIAPSKCAEKIELKSIIMNNGDKKEVMGLIIEAIPAYNVKHKRDSGDPYHMKGEGNGYVITIGDTRIYIAGDTENIPEMSNLGKIDIAFLPMNLPYTMTPEMVADAAKTIKPKVLYPYHFGKTETSKIIELLEKEKDIKVRIRKMK